MILYKIACFLFIYMRDVVKKIAQTNEGHLGAIPADAAPKLIIPGFEDISIFGSRPHKHPLMFGAPPRYRHRRIFSRYRIK